MYPYSAPASHREVTAFMRAHGAGMITTVPRDRNTWTQAHTEMHTGEPASVIYFIKDLPVYGDFLKYYVPPRGQIDVPQPIQGTNPSWYTTLRHDAHGYIAGDSRGFARVGEGFPNAPARMLAKFGDLLIEYGLPRVLTAFTIALYRLDNIGGVRYSTHQEFVPKFLDYARLVAEPRLTSRQKVDVVNRTISHNDLYGMLDSGVPYTLIQEMFPSAIEERV